MLEQLRTKGLVSRAREGRSFVYRPLVVRQQLEMERARSALGPLLGSEKRSGIATLVAAIESMDPKLLAELERIVVVRRAASAA